MKPITRVCHQCGNFYGVGKSNALLHVFTKFPGMSYIESVCSCEEGEIWFPMLEGWKLSDLTNEGRNWQEVITIPSPLPIDFELYYKCIGADPIETHKLNTSLNREADRFAAVLANTPDDLLYDCITAAQKPKLPQRWC